MMQDYFRTTRTWTYGYLSVIPLIIGYEVFIILGGENVRLTAGVWVQRVLSLFGVYGHLALGLFVLLVGAIIILAEHKKDLPWRPHYFPLMISESIIWTPLFAISVGWLTARALLFANLWPLGPAALHAPNAFTRLGLSLGAGVYEELVFRVILVGVLIWLGRQAFPKYPVQVRILAALVGAFIFSLIHYMGPLGDPLDFSARFFTSFTFRFIGGLLLNALYLWRGFGIVAWTHALYDVMVFFQI